MIPGFVKSDLRRGFEAQHDEPRQESMVGGIGVPFGFHLSSDIF
jgi:hypothetical protein